MKKPTKRKMYHKRRKKEKADQRKNAKIQPEMATNPTTKYKYNNNNNKAYQQNQKKHFSTYNNSHHHGPDHHELTKPMNSYTQGLQIWWQTYCTAIQYHTQQQIQWNTEIPHLQIPTNDGHNLTRLEKYAREYETSSGEEEDEDVEKEEDYFLDYNSDINENIEDSKTDDVDAEYLKFLEITHKHREELRLKRAEENL